MLPDLQLERFQRLQGTRKQLRREAHQKWCSPLEDETWMIHRTGLGEGTEGVPTAPGLVFLL
jgi:hypothetical protein